MRYGPVSYTHLDVYKRQQVLLPEKELDELALRDFQFLRRRSDIGAVIRIDEGLSLIHI